MYISIITVVLNNEKLIRRCIESVINQTYKNIEYIIIDGISTDGTLKIINEYQNKIDVIVSEPDRGIYDAMNKGAAIANGEIIFFLNSDDWFVNDYVIENAISYFIAQRELDLLQGNAYRTDNKYKTFKHQIGNLNLNSNLRIIHPAIFLKKSVFQENGGFKLKYKIAADAELAISLLRKNITALQIDLFITYVSKDGVSQSTLRGVFEGFLILFNNNIENKFTLVIHYLILFFKVFFIKIFR